MDLKIEKVTYDDYARLLHVPPHLIMLYDTNHTAMPSEQIPYLPYQTTFLVLNFLIALFRRRLRGFIFLIKQMSPASHFLKNMRF
jgi:hypothetical protein